MIGAKDMFQRLNTDSIKQIRNWVLLALILLLPCLLTGCSDEEYIFLTNPSSNTFLCPSGASCEIEAYTQGVAYDNTTFYNNIPMMEVLY